MSDKYRYTVAVELFIWVDNDMEALEVADTIAQAQNDEHDNRCKVVSVHDTSDTFKKPRKIK